MTNRDDLKGLADWDAHRSAWVPVYGKEDEVAAKLGPTWQFDAYFGAFFGQDPPKPAPTATPAYPECGCYMCQGGSSCGGHMCSVEAGDKAALGQQQRGLMAGLLAGTAEVLRLRREALKASVEIAAGARQVEAKAFDPQQVLGFEEVPAEKNLAVVSIFNENPTPAEVALHEELKKRTAQLRQAEGYAIYLAQAWRDDCLVGELKRWIEGVETRRRS